MRKGLLKSCDERLNVRWYPVMCLLAETYWEEGRRGGVEEEGDSAVKTGTRWRKF